MTQIAAPACRNDLILSQPGADGSVVVKDPRSGTYFSLGEQEAFLLGRLDGTRTSHEICTAFRDRFAESLVEEELSEFVEVARQRNLLLGVEGSVAGSSAGSPDELDEDDGTQLNAKGQRFNFLNWRVRLFDPDRLFTTLAPRLAFLWTREFLIGSLFSVVWALVLLMLNWSEYASHIYDSLNIETLVLAYVTLFVSTTLHEFAHGLTCKRHGGEVHEVGFLMLLFMPCLYCNVSDAWLIRDKSKRLMVTLAGGYCDLCMWALAVFAWRLLLPGTLPYSLAVIMMSVCGVRVFLNFLPLIKLDGYYLLSDWLEIPNLRRKGREYLSGHVRWLLWGAKRPTRENRGGFLLAYGFACWLFLWSYGLALILALAHFSWPAGGLFKSVQLALVSYLLIPRLGSGFVRGEVTQMFLYRHIRLLVWTAILATVTLLLIFVPMTDRATGTFKVRTATRVELRAPVAGFLELVNVDQRDPVSRGSSVGCLDIPDLQSKVAQKAAEMEESQAKLKLLEAGTRPELLSEQREKVRRAILWRDLSRVDLQRKEKALSEEIVRLAKQVTQARLQHEYANETLDRGRKLLQERAMSLAQFRELEQSVTLARITCEQAEAKKVERETLGTLEQETELAKREKEVADSQGTLNLMAAGSRPEEIQAERARLLRLREERKYLDSLQEKLRLVSPIEGIIVTPRLREKVGQYFKEGDLICEIETLNAMEAEIPMEEQLVAKVAAGQTVDFKARSLPWKNFSGTVENIAPVAAVEKLHKKELATVMVTCRIESPPPELCSGMTGYARISCGRCTLGAYLFGSVMRHLRTEYWW